MGNNEIEIIFLDYIKNRKEEDIKRALQNQFIEEIQDSSDLFEKLIENGFLKEANPEEKLSFLKIPELKNIALKLNIEIPELKEEIIETIIKEDVNSDYAEELNFKAYVLTESGKEIIDKNIQTIKNIQKEKAEKIIEAIENNDILEAWKLNQEIKTFEISDLFFKPDLDSESVDFYLEAFEELDKIDLSKYIDNNEEYINNFVLFYKCANIDYKNREKYKEHFLKENLVGSQVENMKLVHSKSKKVEEKVFEDFENFVSMKVGSILEIKNLKEVGIEYKIDNSACPLHKEEKTEEIYEEIGCKCLVMVEM